MYVVWTVIGSYLPVHCFYLTDKREELTKPVDILMNELYLIYELFELNCVTAVDFIFFSLSKPHLIFNLDQIGIWCFEFLT